VKLITPTLRVLPLLLAASTVPASAQVVAGDPFADGNDGAKRHIASGFVCPLKVGPFRRDAVGESDPETHSDFCAYYAQDGVYGTIKLLPAAGTYDPKASLAADFEQQEATGGKKIDETTADLFGSNVAPLSVYTRSYETSKLEELHYRVLFAGADINGWAVETTVEFAEPRDVAVERTFLQAVYDSARREIGAK
jgi:hypothetical protein